MFSGPPLPLPTDLPLNFLLDRIQASEILGAWVRRAAHQLRLRSTARISSRRLLVSADLGFLLSRCNRVALREGSAPVILATDTVIQWRTLQVITGLPHLPGLLVPIGTRSPEEVLAECLASGMQVCGSRVVYRSY
jgi:hypothetical protein